MTLRESPQGGQQFRRYRLFHIHAAAHEDDVRRAHFVDRDGGRQCQTIAGSNRVAIQAGQRPLVDVLFGDAVGHSQCLHGTGEGNHRVIGQGQKYKPVLRELTLCFHN